MLTPLYSEKKCTVENERTCFTPEIVLLRCKESVINMYKKFGVFIMFLTTLYQHFLYSSIFTIIFTKTLSATLNGR